MSVARAQEEIDSREFAEWVVYHSHEPFGDEWLRDATLTAVTAQPYAKKPVQPRDFMPEPRFTLDEPDTTRDVAAIDHFFRMLAKTNGGNRKSASKR